MGVLKSFWKDEAGVTVVEIVLILIVLVGLVVLFKTQLTGIVTSILAKVSKNANSL